ncbi:beta-glucosidase [Microbacterium sp. MYb64]|uniref:beta-glucosidase family protein n=1 Tax=Microbacterium sp. MYb64 TaxID=1848691 RepID=UPI000CFA8F88|nr:glycoside hydrolase family 3 C-terminal domain-containing protein [Microbacterium sp. MYb64]PRB09087.1 hypothetical protein CQ044_01675 [Microbacterium sp. MYb64]
MDEILAALFATSETRSASPAPVPTGARWGDRSLPHAERASALLEALTLEEKSALLYGRGLKLSPERNVWQAWVKGNDRLGIPDVTQGDSPASALVGPPHVTQIPSEHSLGASFDQGSTRRAARVLAAQVRRLGYGVWHAPTLDITRDPRHGRVHENFGEDGYLVSLAGEAYARGFDDERVVPDLKHFGMNAVETDRLTTDYVIDTDRLIGHYLAPFRSVLANTRISMIMTAYAKVNGVHVNDLPDYFDLLRKDWGFEGIVRNDAMAVHSLASLSHGMDQEFRDEEFFGSVLLSEIAAGRFDEADVDAAVLRILTTMLRTGLFDDAPVPTEWTGPTEEETAAVRDAAARGVVLLENRGALLPLDPSAAPRIAVFGPAAIDDAIAGGPTRPILDRDTFLDALRSGMPGAVIEHAPALGPVALTDAFPGFAELPIGAFTHDGVEGLRVTFFDDAGEELETRGGAGLSLQTANWAFGGVSPGISPVRGTVRARWVGTWASEAGDHVFDVVTGGTLTLRIDGDVVLQHDGRGYQSERSEAAVTMAAGEHLVEAEYLLPDPRQGAFVESSAGAVKIGVMDPSGAIPTALREVASRAAAADLAIVVVRDIASEGFDRLTLRLPGRQDELISAVAAANPRTVVVLETASAVLTPWRESIGALVQGWYGGSRGNAAIVDVLTGEKDASGRLPVTFPARDEDLPTFAAIRFPGVDKVIRMDEDETGYRFFSRSASPDVAYPFGYGLSYASVEIGDLSAPASVIIPVGAADSGARTDRVPVTVTVRNTGGRAGTVVPQLYVTSPGSETAQLKAFASVDLEPGEQRVVDLSIAWADLAVFRGGAWSIPEGTHLFRVGAHAEDDLMRAEVEVVVR